MFYAAGIATDKNVQKGFLDFLCERFYFRSQKRTKVSGHKRENKCSFSFYHIQSLY